MRKCDDARQQFDRRKPEGKGDSRTIIEGEHGTEEEETDRQLWYGKGIRPVTHMLKTHSYQNKPDGPVGNDLDLMKHDDNEHWWLAEKIHVGYVPAAYIMVILDDSLSLSLSLHEDESDKTR